MSGKDHRAKVLKDAQEAINGWIPKRRETVAALENLAADIQGAINAAVTPGIAAEGLSIRLMGLAAILGTGGLAVPITALSAKGLHFSKPFDKNHQFSRVLEEAGDKINEEMDAYRKVIESLDILHEIDQLPDTTQIILAPYSNLKEKMDRIINIAKASTASSMKDVAGHSFYTAIAQATEKAASQSAIGAILIGFPQRTCETIAKEAGEGAGRAVADSMKKGTVSEDQERTVTSSVQEASTAVMEKAIASAGRTLGRLAHKRLANAAIPFSVSAWNAYRRLVAGKELAEEERDLREKIAELKEEANKIAIAISLMQIVLPFPECEEIYRKL